MGSFGASDSAVLDLAFGRFTPTAKLPFELPSSTDAVRAQLPDVPHDSEAPLFPYGHGLTF
jgi:beta-glucosidase